MMKFTLGLAIIAFTIIVGSYKFIENTELIQARKFALQDSIRRRDQNTQLLERLKDVKKLGMAAGEDQKFNIERMLGIGAPDLEFQFIGQGRGNTNRSIHRHSFRISGPSDYSTIRKLLRDLATIPGFTVHKICFSCGRTRGQELAEGQYPVNIDGYLYVYDPNAL